MIQSTNLSLFAGISVTDYTAALKWYEQLLGYPPAFLPNDIEAVWELAENRFIYIELRPQHAGHTMNTIFIDDLDTLVAQISERGIEAVKRESYPNGVSKVSYHDPDGNEISFGGAAPNPNS